MSASVAASALPLPGAAEIEPGMPARGADLDARLYGGIGDLEVLAREGDVLLGPRPAHQPHDLLMQVPQCAAAN